MFITERAKVLHCAVQKGEVVQAKSEFAAPTQGITNKKKSLTRQQRLLFPKTGFLFSARCEQQYTKLIVLQVKLLKLLDISGFILKYIKKSLSRVNLFNE